MDAPDAYRPKLTTANCELIVDNMFELYTAETTLLNYWHCCHSRANPCIWGLFHWKGLNPLGLFYPSLGGSVSGANVKGAKQFEGLVRDSACPESVLHPELPNFFQLRPQGAKKKQVFRPCAVAFYINQMINRRTNYGKQIFSLRKKII